MSALTPVSANVQALQIGGQLPIDVLHWGTAILPIVILLILLIGFNWAADSAAVVGMLLAAAIALTVFQTPIQTLAIAVGEGVWRPVRRLGGAVDLHGRR